MGSVEVMTLDLTGSHWEKGECSWLRPGLPEQSLARSASRVAWGAGTERASGLRQHQRGEEDGCWQPGASGGPVVTALPACCPPATPSTCSPGTRSAHAPSRAHPRGRARGAFQLLTVKPQPRTEAVRGLVQIRAPDTASRVGYTRPQRILRHEGRELRLVPRLDCRARCHALLESRLLSRSL